MDVPEKPKPKQRRKRKKTRNTVNKMQNFLEARLTLLWIKDLEESAKMTRKAMRLAKRRKLGYIR